MEVLEVAQKFLQERNLAVSRLNGGLINDTFKVDDGTRSYILQKLNTKVFTSPQNIAENTLALVNLAENSEYSGTIAKPVNTLDSKSFFFIDDHDSHWKMQEFIENSFTFSKVENAEMAFAATSHFSGFYKVINEKEFRPKAALPNFLNFRKRKDDFELAVKNAPPHIKNRGSHLLSAMEDFYPVLKNWIKLNEEAKLPYRAIHADPKISNILFNKEKKAVAVIDLDTLMTGTLLYDYGDMVRSYCNIGAEDDSDKDNFCAELFAAVHEGFMSYLADYLCPLEIEYLKLAPQAVIMVQAMRFIADFFQGNKYYHVEDSDQNMRRAENQLNLLKNLTKTQKDIAYKC